MINTKIERIRDPFLIEDNGVYYIYGTGVVKSWEDTGWICYKNTSGKLDGPWTQLETPLYIKPEGAETNFWAPEVHKYNGKFYMIATYYSSVTKHRGCSILMADSPEGPFVEITNGYVTPKDWDAIDGTLYVDEDGQPWLVFVHEWTCTDDGIGRMSVAKLSEDLTHFVSEPVDLFRADAPSWSNHRVTDGCFMYKTKDNQLLMIWSNIADAGGYCVGIARSKNGKVDGEWIQEDALLYSKDISGKHDGGHGMIFEDKNGKKYLVIHAPNRPCDECEETAIFVPVYEENGTLKCAL